MATEIELEQTDTIVDIKARLIRAVLQYDTWDQLRVVTSAPTGTIAEVIADTGTHADPISGKTISNTGKFRYSNGGWASYDIAGGAEGIPASAISFSIGKSVLQKLNEIRTLDDARTSDASDQDRLALQDLINSGYRNIRFVGGKGTGTTDGEYQFGYRPFTGQTGGTSGQSSNDYISSKGSFTLANGKPANGLRLFGDGMDRTRLKLVDPGGSGLGAPFLFTHSSLSADLNENLKGLTIEHMTMEGLGLDGVSGGQRHTLAFAGVTRLLIQHVRAIGITEDFLIMWPGAREADPAHNVNARILHSIIDGEKKKSRNGISFEDMVDWLVHDCDFLNLCNPDGNISVACIDVEPRSAKTFRNQFGQVLGNRFRNSGRAAFSAFLNGPDYYDLKAHDYIFQGNIVEGAGMGVEISGGFTDEISTAVNKHDIQVLGNLFTDVERPFVPQGAYGASFRGNRVTNAGTIFLGTQSAKGNRDVDISGNTFSRVGRSLGPVVIQDAATIECNLSDNRVLEAGREDNLGGWFYLGRVGPVEITMNNNRVRNERGRMKAFAQISDGVTVSSKSTKIGNVSGLDVPMTAVDNFVPPAPFEGVIQNITGVVVAPQTLYTFDVAYSGAVVGKAYEAWLVGFVPSSTDANRSNLDIFAYGQAINVVRVTVWNNSSNTGTGVLSGSKLYVREKQ